MPSSPFLQEAYDRGFVHQCTDVEGLDAALSAGQPVAAYIGFDATADSLHVGSLVQIMLLRLLQKHGHRPIVLLGGGTTRIGDPSGKDESRKMLSDADIAANMAGIRRVFDPFLRFGAGPSDALLANNADWLDALGYVELLRDVGPHFSVNRMLGFDNVRLRLEREQPLSFLEFNYMILQSYDFRELNRRHGVTLQMGGRDQWGNIVCGVELVRRTGGRIVFGLTTPLIETASGAKMGKTAQGAVWLTADRLPASDYWQFWRNTEDADVKRFLRLFTEEDVKLIDELPFTTAQEINDAKRRLATEATALAHGRQIAEQIAAAMQDLYVGGRGGGHGVGLGAGVLIEAIPSIYVPREELLAGVPLVRVFVEAGLAASLSEVRRLMRNGGVRVNDVPVSDENLKLTETHLQHGVIRLSAGRKQHRLVRPA